MNYVLVTQEDVKNELDIDIAQELNLQPKQSERWLARIALIIINHIASYAFGGIEQVNRMLENEECRKIVKEAIIEQIDFLSENNYVQADKVMNTGKGQVAMPVIAPLAHQMLMNAGLLFTGKVFNL